MQYDPQLNESDPKALFNVLVPESFIRLQSAIEKKLMDDNCVPLLKKGDFIEEFKDHFDGNIVEMKEAVRFLGYQGKFYFFLKLASRVIISQLCVQITRISTSF